MRPDPAGPRVLSTAALFLLAGALFPSIASATSLTVTQRGAGLLGVLLMMALAGIGLVTFARPALETVSDTVVHSLGRSFVVGLLAETLAIPTLAVLAAGLALTVVGLLLIPFVVAVGILAILAATALGLLAVGHALGETRTRRRMAQGELLSPNSYRYLGSGLLVPAAIWAVWVAFGGIPYAGAVLLGGAVVATWLLGTIGLGATVLSRAGVRAEFAGRIIPPEALTDEYLWATPQLGVQAVRRPEKRSTETSR